MGFLLIRNIRDGQLEIIKRKQTIIKYGGKIKVEKQNKEVKKIYFESASLFKELVEGDQLKNLRSVKSNPYPSYCFLATKKVMDIVSEFIVNHNMKCDRTVDDSWEDFEKLVVNAESKPDTIVTRNLRVVKRAVSEGYGNMLKRTLVDQHKKKAFVFYANARITEIKAEEDAKSQERYEQRPKADITPVDMKEKKKNIDTEMSKLIKKAMEEQK